MRAEVAMMAARNLWAIVLVVAAIIFLAAGVVLAFNAGDHAGRHGATLILTGPPIMGGWACTIVATVSALLAKELHAEQVIRDKASRDAESFVKMGSS